MEAAIQEKGKALTLKWCKGKIYERTIVSILHSRVSAYDEGEVISVDRSQVHKAKPQGLNTVKMLKVASKTYGMSAHDTMHIAERLYLRGYITYPRTESTTYSTNFNFEEILQQHRSHPEWGYYAAKLLKGEGLSKPKKGVDAGDHPPITPVLSATKDDLSDREWRLYQFITKTFLGSISEDAVYDQVRVIFSVGPNESFKLKGTILKKAGFLEIMNWQAAAEKEIPTFKVGD